MFSTSRISMAGAVPRAAFLVLVLLADPAHAARPGAAGRRPAPCPGGPWDHESLLQHDVSEMRLADEPASDGMNMMQVSMIPPQAGRAQPGEEAAAQTAPLGPPAAAAQAAAPAPPSGPTTPVRFLSMAAMVSAAKGQSTTLTSAGLVAILVMALKFKLRRGQEAPKPETAAKELESVAEMPRDDAEEPSEQAEMEAGDQAAVQLYALPQPMRRLRNIGASYVIPRNLIDRCTNNFLSFDIPTMPCVWPLRAVLSRPAHRGSWTKLQLTVDIIAASALPPLLTCTRAGIAACPKETGGTGGTGSPPGAEAADDASGASDDDATGSSQGGSEGDRPWLKVCNAGGTVVATIIQRPDGCIVQRQDRSLWDVGVHLNAGTPWITIARQGQEIAQASSLGDGREGHLQADTLPDVQSPESACLLICMLAVLAFKH